MKVYLHNAKRGDFRYAQMVATEHYFWERGYEVVLFETEELDSGKLDGDLFHEAETTIVTGSVGCCREALRRAGRPEPPNLDFPEELTSYVGRKVEFTTLGEIRNFVRAGAESLPLHVKPRFRQKLFTGKVISAFRDLISLSGVPNEEPVIVQEVVNFVSEWRATILRGEVRSVAHYKGDPLSFPNPDVLQAALKAFAHARPIGFAMDWGITDDGRTLLVEVNDGFALGNYGCPGHIYTALLEARWRELMGLEDNFVGV